MYDKLKNGTEIVAMKCRNSCNTVNCTVQYYQLPVFKTMSASLEEDKSETIRVHQRDGVYLCCSYAVENRK